MPAALQEEVRRWSARDPDPASRVELGELLQAAAVDTDAAAELADCFAGSVGFGTAGLRAVVGPGPARMNRLVIRRATAGLVRWLREREPDRVSNGVAVGRDARRGSEAFAEEALAVLVGAGVRAHVLPAPLPTPVLAFAVRHLGVAAGLMVTASHNPPGYNGVKVYGADGAQLAPAEEGPLARAIESVAWDAAVPLGDPADAETATGAETAYEEAVWEPVRDLPAGGLRVVVSPLHGVAGSLAVSLLARAGFHPELVAEQAAPDGAFPTVAVPNPEEPPTFDLALARADEVGAGLVLVLDPDGDRLGAAVRDVDGGWRILGGDDIGVLLADHVLGRTEGADRAVATSVVSCRLLQRMAAAAGVHYVDTLTGFKWIARAVDARPDLRLVFAYEEALGYQVGTVVRDKDGVVAGLHLAHAAAAARRDGTDLLGRLDALASRFGVHARSQVVVPLSARDRDVAGRVLDRLVTDPPRELGGRAVEDVVDHRSGAEGLPPAPLVVLRLDGGHRVLVRPSGTEPKLKGYLEVVQPVGGDGPGGARRRAGRLLERLRAEVGAHLSTDGS